MFKENRIRTILEEMVMEAAEEINFDYDEGCSELVEQKLWLNHDLELNKVETITWQIMKIIANEVESWQNETLQNF